MVGFVMNNKDTSSPLRLVISDGKPVENSSHRHVDEIEKSVDQKADNKEGKAVVTFGDFKDVFIGFLKGIGFILLFPFFLARKLGDLGEWMYEFTFRFLWGTIALVFVLLIGKLLFEVITH